MHFSLPLSLLPIFSWRNHEARRLVVVSEIAVDRRHAFVGHIELPIVPEHARDPTLGRHCEGDLLTLFWVVEVIDVEV